MRTTEKELLQRIADLQRFAEENGYPIAEMLQEELDYYSKEFNQ